MTNKILKQELEKIPPVSCFLVKVASRCNLDCDYCYVYQHADQSWKNMPKFLDQEKIKEFIRELTVYTSKTKIKKILVILHGGEPLLYGAKRIVDFSSTIRTSLSDCEIDISLQTNGVLLTDETCQLFEENNIAVSLSIDGPKEIHNLHRPFRNGKDSFYETTRALELLQKHSTIFTGVIAVVDPRFPAKRYFEFFEKYDIPSLDFLLPDANYVKPPPYKENSPDIYLNWLIDAFETWFNSYPQITLRTFESLISCLAGAGHASGTDAFGFGDISLLCIETDGSYHDLDVLKVTAEGQSSLGCSVSDTSIISVLKSDKIQLHRKLLSKKGMSNKCLECDVLNICGGGSVPHRFNGDFYNPSIYCNELYGLITHVKEKLKEVIKKEHENIVIEPKDFSFDVDSYYLRANENKSFYSLLEKYKDYSSNELITILGKLKSNSFISEKTYSLIASLQKNDFDNFSIKPSIKFYYEVAKSHLRGVKRKNLVGDDINIDWEEISSYLPSESTSHPCPLHINDNDYWLRVAFEGLIEFRDDLDGKYRDLITDAFSVIKEYDNELYEEILCISPSIQFIHDTTASPDKAVSFSDNIVPGCLYIACECSGKLVSRNLAAESIIHEHLHQKLYMLQNFIDLFDQNYPYVESPWREELRPPSGLLHAIFVFVEIFSFWCYLFKNKKVLPQENISANIDIKRIFKQLNAGFDVLETTKLSSKGKKLQRTLIEKFKKDCETCQALF